MSIQKTAERMSGEQFKPWSGSTIKSIEAFLTDLQTVQAEFPEFYMSAFNFWGKTQDQMRQLAASQIKKNKRRAGVKALVAKYGHETASNIVFKHSGRKIR